MTLNVDLDEFHIIELVIIENGGTNRYLSFSWLAFGPSERGQCISATHI